MAASVLFLTSIVIAVNAFSTNQPDVGCNYVNIGGMGIPIGSCMQYVYKGFEIGVQLSCDATTQEIEVLANTRQDCSGLTLHQESLPTDSMVGMYCSEAYADAKCDEMSIKVFSNSTCVGDLGEFRVLYDVCLFAEEGKYNKLECDQDAAQESAILREYATMNGDCSDANLVNTTVFTEGVVAYDGQAACVEIDGCSSAADDHATTKGPVTAGATSTLPSAPSKEPQQHSQHGTAPPPMSTQAAQTSSIIAKTPKTILFVVVAVVAIAFIACAIILTTRYLDKKKAAQVELDMVAMAEEGVGEIVVAENEAPSGKAPEEKPKSSKQHNEMEDKLLTAAADGVTESVTTAHD